MIDMNSARFSSLPLIWYLSVLQKELKFLHLYVEKPAELVTVALESSLRVKGKLAFAAFFHGELSMPN